MKKIILILLTLIACSVNSQIITFSTPMAADSGVMYMGQDTTSWDQDRLSLTQIFKDDGTIWGAVPTLTELGDMFVKIYWWPVGSSDSETIGDIYKTPSILDTVYYESGNEIAGLVNDSLLQYFTMINNNRSVTSYNANVDTVFVFSSAEDTIGAIIYFHPGGTAGDPPDSTRYKDM